MSTFFIVYVAHVVVVIAHVDVIIVATADAFVVCYVVDVIVVCLTAVFGSLLFFVWLLTYNLYY